MLGRMFSLVTNTHFCVLCDTQCRSIDICPACQTDLPWNRYCCVVCAVPLQRNTSSICPDCQKSVTPFSAILAPLEYRFPVDTMVNRFKNQRGLAEGQVLADLMTEHLAKALAPLISDDNLVMAVPLHPIKQRRRGFNQAALLAKTVAHRFRWRLNLALCRRTKQGAEVKHLRVDQRKRAVQGVFQVDAAVKNHRVILVDDVVTTGATVFELSQTCLAAGAADVVVLSAARTPQSAL